MTKVDLTLLTDDELETFIIVQQSLAYTMRDKWKNELEIADEAFSNYKRLQDGADFTKEKLCAVLQFLNASRGEDGGTDWFAELGFSDDTNKERGDA